MASKYTIQGYDAAKALMTAADSGADDRASLAAALSSVKFDSPRGPVEIDPATNNVVQNIDANETAKDGDALPQKVIATIKAVRDEPNGCSIQ